MSLINSSLMSSQDQNPPNILNAMRSKYFIFGYILINALVIFMSFVFARDPLPAVVLYITLVLLPLIIFVFVYDFVLKNIFIKSLGKLVQLLACLFFLFTLAVILLEFLHIDIGESEGYVLGIFIPIAVLGSILAAVLVASVVKFYNKLTGKGLVCGEEEYRKSTKTHKFFTSMTRIIIAVTIGLPIVLFIYLAISG